MTQETNLKNNKLYAFGPFHLDAGERRLQRRNESVPLPRKTFDLLQILVASAGRLQTREALIAALWPNRIVEEQGLTTIMHGLRKALGDEGSSPTYIETVRGIGYRFIAQVSEEPRPEKAWQTKPPTHAGKRPTRARAGARRLSLIAASGLTTAAVAALLLWWFVPNHESTAVATETATSIAVLPFENLSADPGNAYFVQGIRDTIISRLATVGSLRVVSRMASNRYTSHPGNLSVIAAQLGVDAILEGSVQKVGKKVLINLQLVDVRSNASLWAATYMRKLEEILEVETEVATRVATTLTHELQPTEVARLGRSPTTNPKAYLSYLKANYRARRVLILGNAQNPSKTVSQAAALYRLAINRDPGFALAWARLSLLKSKAHWYSIDTHGQNWTTAWEAANQAAKLAPNLPAAHVALGYAYYYVKRDYAAALQQFRIAHADMPRNARIVAAMGYIHRRQARWEKALSELQRAATLDPRNAEWREEIGLTLILLRRYPQAIQSLNQAIAIAPEDYDAKMKKTGALILLGELDRAGKVLATIPRRIDPQGLITILRYDVARLSGNPEAALAALKAADVLHSAQAVKADVLMLAGKHEAARAQYKKASERLRTTLQKFPENAFVWSALGLAQAALGNDKAAIKAGKRALELHPISEDVVAGPIFMTALAKIYSRLGNAAQAVKLLEKLMSIPAGRKISAALLRLDPVWNPIRDAPGFQALLEKYRWPRPMPTQVSAPPATSP